MSEVGNTRHVRAWGSSVWRWSAAVSVALCLCVGSTHAQVSAATEAEDVEVALASHGTILAEPAYTSLETAWREVQADLDRHAWVEATGRLSYLVDLRTDLGLPNLAEFSSVLMRAADEASASGARDAASALAEAAAVLSPDLVAAHLAVTRHRFDSAPLGLTATIRSLRNAVEKLGFDLPSYVALVGNAATLWVDLIVLLSLMLAVALYVRYSRYAASDIRRMMPPGVTLVQTNVLLFIALLAPFLVGLGLLVTAVVWLVVFASYVRPTERIAILLAVLAVASTPAMTRKTVQGMTYAAHPASVLHRCSAGVCGSDDRSLLKQWIADDVYSQQSHFVLALTLLRQAGTKGDKDSYELAQRYAQTAHDLRATPETFTLLGNVAYMRGTRHCAGLREGAAGVDDRIAGAQRDAVKLWKQAIAKTRRSSPPNVPALYNSSVALTQLGEHNDADPLLERAMKADHERVLMWTKTISRDGANLVRCKLGLFANRQVMLPRLPIDGLRYSVMNERVPADGLLVPFSALVTGRLGAGFIGFTGLAGAAAMLLLWMFAKVLRPTLPCTECNAPAVPATRLETHDGPVCSRCVETDVRRAFVDAKKQWVHEQQLEFSKVRRAQRARLVTWVLPGFGHLLRGKPLRGLTFLAITLGCLFVALDLHSMVDDPYAPLQASMARAIAFALPGGIAYVLAIIDAHAGGTAE
jgi:tetratricopeptide (TPR) repeat protein